MMSNFYSCKPGLAVTGYGKLPTEQALPSLNIVPGLGYLYLRQRIVFGVLLLIANLLLVLQIIMFPSTSNTSNSEAWLSLLFFILLSAAFICDAFLLAYPKKETNAVAKPK
jgi:hypothetical protein